VYPVVVLAGGLGTRVARLTGEDRPKALLDLAGRPFIHWKMRELADAGATDVVMLVGHGSVALRAMVGEGSTWGLRVRYVADGPRLLGTGGAIRQALPVLPEAFWVTYGDSLLHLPMGTIEADFAHRTALGAMTVLHNRDQWLPSNVTIRNGVVVGYEKAASAGSHEWIDYGMLLMRRAAFERALDSTEFDLASVLVALIGDGALVAYPVTQRFYEIGTEEAYRDVAARMAAGPLFP
jgi:NDP-sugar pyrophosphorylase family protein